MIDLDQALTVTGLAAVAGAAYTVSLAAWPYGRCPRCGKRKGRSRGSLPRRWGKCRRCGGKGERIRPGARAVRRAIGRPVD